MSGEGIAEELRRIGTIPLSPRLLDALDDCARWSRRGEPYWWRIASMKKLEALGLVESCRPNKNGRNKAYLPTKTGLALLKQPGTLKTGLGG